MQTAHLTTVEVPGADPAAVPAPDLIRPARSGRT